MKYNMLNNFCICYVDDAEISEVQYDRIIELKNQHWSYPVESQRKWRRENLFSGDCHLWIEDEKGRIVAYLNLVSLSVRFDEKTDDAKGVGNVCVDKEFKGSGIGLLLMQVCNYYIHCHKKIGILLCKESLIDFYSKAGWIVYRGKTKVRGLEFDGTVMATTTPGEMSMEIERNF